MCSGMLLQVCCLFCVEKEKVKFFFGWSLFLLWSGVLISLGGYKLRLYQVLGVASILESFFKFILQLTRLLCSECSLFPIWKGILTVLRVAAIFSSEWGYYKSGRL